MESVESVGTGRNGKDRRVGGLVGSRGERVDKKIKENPSSQLLEVQSRLVLGWARRRRQSG
jgi:hypothetical protein